MPHALAGSTPPITAPPAPAPSVFKPQELQLDLFGVYGVGHAPDHAGPFREHAWGGGIGLNYFQENYFGIGIDADVKRGRENQATGTNRKTFEQYTASIIYRLPMEEYAMAPYFFFGGGLTSGVGTIASAHAGLGMEYRLIPNQVGLFADTRWTYYGDRYGRGDQNNVQIRSGIRFLF
jgi:hypothetical protein